MRTKWLQEIIKGWYLLVKPSLAEGDSSVWYANFWDFLRIYLNVHFGDQYCLSAENSLDLHSGSPVIPKQVIVISSKGGGVPRGLPYDTSLFVYSDPNNLPEERTILHGLQVMSLPYALCRVPAAYFQKSPKEAEIALQLIRTSSDLSEIILKFNFKSAAARLLGALRFLSKDKLADDLSHDMESVGWKIKEENPFASALPPLPLLLIKSPYAARISSLWRDAREKVISHFPPPPGISQNSLSYLDRLTDLYEKDAYNSLSIEGYQVDDDLIARVKNNNWNPDIHPQDLQDRNALAARGYYEASLEVKKSILRLFEGERPGEVVEQDIKKWYKSLFAPTARAGLIRQEDLVGYRKSQVYIRGSRHVPLPKEALLDAMETCFDCLKNEPHPAVRAILGHYLFVYIHPYMDGNGRIARFLMNVMLASGGYPWTIVRVKRREQYIHALEEAGPGQNIVPFAQFIAGEMQTM